MRVIRKKVTHAGLEPIERIVLAVESTTNAAFAFPWQMGSDGLAVLTGVAGDRRNRPPATFNASISGPSFGSTSRCGAFHSTGLGSQPVSFKRSPPLGRSTQRVQYFDEGRIRAVLATRICSGAWRPRRTPPHEEVVDRGTWRCGQSRESQAAGLSSRQRSGGLSPSSCRYGVVKQLAAPTGAVGTQSCELVEVVLDVDPRPLSGRDSIGSGR